MQSTLVSPKVSKLPGMQPPCESVVDWMLPGLKLDQDLLTIS